MNRSPDPLHGESTALPSISHAMMSPAPSDLTAMHRTFLDRGIEHAGQLEVGAVDSIPFGRAPHSEGPLRLASQRVGRRATNQRDEALIRTWPRLRAWIDANREKLNAWLYLRRRPCFRLSLRSGGRLLPRACREGRALHTSIERFESLAGYTIDTHESRFRKLQDLSLGFPAIHVLSMRDQMRCGSKATRWIPADGPELI
jgi:hypothetical protein